MELPETMTPEDWAQAELSARAAGRERMIDFVRYCRPGYVVDPFHELIARELDDVIAGKTRRLMIFAAPQSGKSCLASEHFPAYWLAKRPDDPVIVSSYGADLALTKSQKARSIMEGESFGRLFPNIKTNQQSRAIDHWLLADHYGGLRAAGVDGGITGHPATLGIIDDPFKDMKEASSQLIRDNAFDWYRTAFRTRVASGGAIVIVMTRWSPDDLCGRLIREKAEEWRVVRIPAIAETQDERDANDRYLGLPTGQADPLGRAPGESASPTRYPVAEYESLRRALGPLYWSALYTGTPRSAEGNRFKRAWFGVVDFVSGGERLELVRYWDKAAGSTMDSCFTVGLLMARSSTTGLFYVLDMVRGQWSSLQRRQVMVATAERDHERYRGNVQTWIEREPAAGGKESAEADARAMSRWPVYFENPSSEGSKELRAEPMAAGAENGLIKLVRGPGLDVETWLTEITQFPTGSLKDIVDASSGAYNKLHHGAKSAPPTYVQQPTLPANKIERARGKINPKEMSRAIFGPSGRPEFVGIPGFKGHPGRN